MAALFVIHSISPRSRAVLPPQQQQALVVQDRPHTQHDQCSHHRHHQQRRMHPQAFFAGSAAHQLRQIGQIVHHNDQQQLTRMAHFPVDRMHQQPEQRAVHQIEYHLVPVDPGIPHLIAQIVDADTHQEVSRRRDRSQTHHRVFAPHHGIHGKQNRRHRDHQIALEYFHIDLSRQDHQRAAQQQLFAPAFLHPIPPTLFLHSIMEKTGLSRQWAGRPINGNLSLNIPLPVCYNQEKGE